MKVALKYQVTIIVETDAPLDINTSEVREELFAAVDRQIKQSGLIEDGDPTEVTDFTVTYTGPAAV